MRNTVLPTGRITALPPTCVQSRSAYAGRSFGIGSVTPETSRALLQLHERRSGNWLRHCGAGIGFGQRCLDDVMRWCERACRICGDRVSGEQESLAAASAKVLRALVATAAGFRHPFFSPKTLERGRVSPDRFQSSLADVFEFESENHFRGVAGKHFACGIDEHQSASPTAHAGFGKARVIVGDHEIYANASGEAFFRGGNSFCSPFNLLSRGQQRGAVL